MRIFLLPATCCLLALSTACASEAPSPDHPAVALHAARGAQPAFVEITGLSSAELSGLRTARFGPRDWAALLKVSVGESAAALPPVEGR